MTTATTAGRPVPSTPARQRLARMILAAALHREPGRRVTLTRTRDGYATPDGVPRPDLRAAVDELVGDLPVGARVDLARTGTAKHALDRTTLTTSTGHSDAWPAGHPAATHRSPQTA